MSRKTFVILLLTFLLSLATAYLVGWGLQRMIARSLWLTQPFYPFLEREPLEHPRLETKPFLRPSPRFLTRFSPLWVAGRTFASEVFFFLIASLAIALFPQRFHTMLEGLRKHSFSYLGIGITTAFLGFLLILLAIFTWTGLPFLPYLLLLFGFLAALGLLVSLLGLGNLLRRVMRLPESHLLIDLALGIFTFFIVASLPLFGMLAFLMASLWGWGTIVATRFGAAQGWSALSFAEAESESYSLLDNS